MDELLLENSQKFINQVLWIALSGDKDTNWHYDVEQDVFVKHNGPNGNKLQKFKALFSIKIKVKVIVIWKASLVTDNGQDKNNMARWFNPSA